MDAFNTAVCIIISCGVILIYMIVGSMLGRYLSKKPKETQPVITHGIPECPHSWTVQSDTMLDAGGTKKHILVMTCLSCGAVDNTVNEVSPPPLPLPPIGECRHQWKLKTDIQTPSPMEQITGILFQLQVKYPTQAQRNLIKTTAEKLQQSIPPNPGEWFFKRDVLQVRECTECGIIHTITNKVENSE